MAVSRAGVDSPFGDQKFRAALTDVCRNDRSTSTPCVAALTPVAEQPHGVAVNL